MKKGKLPIEAVGHRLIVRVDEIAKEGKQLVEGKVILTHSTDDFEREREFQEKGTVVDIGPSAYNLAHHDENWVKLGDHILYKKYEGHKYLDDESGVLYRIINDEDVIVKIT